MSEQDTQPTTVQPEAPAADDPSPVPYARFSEVVRERNTLREQSAEWKAAQLEHRAALEAAQQQAAARVSELEARLAEMESAAAWKGNEVELARQGIHDPEIIDYLRHRYSTAPVEEGAERPAFGEWFDAYRATDPAVLRPFQQATESAPPRPIKANDGAQSVGSDRVLDPTRMTQREYMEHRSQILKKEGRIKFR